MLWAKDWWRNSSYQQAFIWIKQGSNSVQENVWKKYYVILFPQNLVIFFCDGHDFILKRSILINVPFIWSTRDMKWIWNSWHQDKPRRINIRWRRNRKRKNRKRRNINCRMKGNWRKRKGSKEKDDGKGSRAQRVLSKATHVQLPSFTKATTMLSAKDWWRNSSYHQALIWIKQGSNSKHDNVWKKYYAIPQTFVIFFLDGQDFVLKRSILINVPFIWGMRDMKWSWNLWHQDKPRRMNTR